MKQESIMEQLVREAGYAQKSDSRDLLVEIYGKAKMARQLDAISYEEFMKLNHMTTYYINTHAGSLEWETRTDVWIPGRERLPEEPEGAFIVMEALTEYIVMVSGAKKPTIMKYARDGERWDDDTEAFYPGVAWQPLRDPYLELAD